MALPYSTIGRHPDSFPAVPSAWNEKYDKIDANFSNLDTRVVGCETEIDDAKGDKPTLADMLAYLQEQVEGVSPDMQNAILGTLLEAMDLGSLANREIVKTLTKRFQTGTVIIENKGIISGCTITKSATATRNINLASGQAFAGGMIIPIEAETNGAAIPSNSSGMAKYCYIYLAMGATKWEAFCTGLDESVPANGIPLYRVTVPAGNTEANDPYISNVTLTDVRRLEPNALTSFTSAPFVYVSLPFNMLDTNYAIDLDVYDFTGGGFQLGYVYADERQSNGFKICLNGTADNVKVRWTAKKFSL